MGITDKQSDSRFGLLGESVIGPGRISTGKLSSPSQSFNILPSGMMPGRVGIMPEPTNPLQMSWHDSSWVPILNPSNIMDYFSDRNNPFYDRTCNNEIIKMQRASLEQLNTMTGYEYILLHVQDPILYVVRKQHRTSPTQATPLADYYIIAGVIYQAPDLANIINSRILASVHHLQSALEESMSYSRYHPSRGYTWELRGDTTKVKREAPREEPSSAFQRQRVDMLLGELTHKFPLPILQPPASKPPPSEPEIKTEPREIKQEIKQESMKPPPEKKPRIN